MTDQENKHLDALVYDIIKSFNSAGGANHIQIATAVENAIGKVPPKNVEATIQWLKHEGCIRPEGDRYYHVEFETMVPLP